MKIFIIEDEPAIREELVQLLQKYGYQCDSSDDFHHIVQAALSSGANLILLDINLPYRMKIICSSWQRRHWSRELFCCSTRCQPFSCKQQVQGNAFT